MGGGITEVRKAAGGAQGEEEEAGWQENRFQDSKQLQSLTLFLCSQ